MKEATGTSRHSLRGRGALLAAGALGSPRPVHQKIYVLDTVQRTGEVGRTDFDQRRND